MNKKSAFIVVRDLPRKMVLYKVFSFTNVPIAINSL
jgi:hypothetical protein